MIKELLDINFVSISHLIPSSLAHQVQLRS